MRDFATAVIFLAGLTAIIWLLLPKDEEWTALCVQRYPALDERKCGALVMAAQRAITATASDPEPMQTAFGNCSLPGNSRAQIQQCHAALIDRITLLRERQGRR